MKLTTSPDYLVDLFLLPAYIGAAFLMLRYRHAALMVVYLLALFGAAAAIVYWFQPFEVIYTNDNVSSLRTGFVLSIIVSTAMCFAFAWNYQRNADRLSDSLYTLGKVNDDNQLLMNVVSHDVRNYLGRLVLLIDLAKSRTEGGARLEELDNLDSTIQELTRLVTDLPVVRNLSAGSARNATQTVAFDEIMKKTDLIFRHLMVEKQLAFDKSAVQPMLLQVNPDIFTHIILSNLIGNAIKFSSQGGTIALGLQEQRGRKVLTITNQAPVAHLPNLRRVAGGEPVTSSLPGTHQEQGQGLGISILRRFCRLYGIEFTMSVDAAPGQDLCTVRSALAFS
jgi:K+-sensing histidine kinase KdpD